MVDMIFNSYWSMTVTGNKEFGSLGPFKSQISHSTNMNWFSIAVRTTWNKNKIVLWDDYCSKHWTHQKRKADRHMLRPNNNKIYFLLETSVVCTSCRMHTIQPRCDLGNHLWPQDQQKFFREMKSYGHSSKRLLWWMNNHQTLNFNWTIWVLNKK